MYEGAVQNLIDEPLNESPSEKEGKFGDAATVGDGVLALNESPSEKEGKLSALNWCDARHVPQ